MLMHADEHVDGGRPGISELLGRLGADGRDWAEAELAMARLELGELRSHAMRMVLFAAVAFAAVFCAMVALSQAGIAALTPYAGEALSALTVAGLLAIVVVLCVLALRQSFSWRTESIFFRWFGQRHMGGSS